MIEKSIASSQGTNIGAEACWFEMKEEARAVEMLIR
jgi:hypothetical protein